MRSELAAAEVDLIQYGESYYFREADRGLSLAATLPQAKELAAAGQRADSADVRQAALMLDDGLEEVLGLLRRQFLHHVADGTGTLAAFEDDHWGPASR